MSNDMLVFMIVCVSIASCGRTSSMPDDESWKHLDCTTYPIRAGTPNGDDLMHYDQVARSTNDFEHVYVWHAVCALTYPSCDPGADLGVVQEYKVDVMAWLREQASACGRQHCSAMAESTGARRFQWLLDDAPYGEFAPPDFWAGAMPSPPSSEPCGVPSHRRLMTLPR